MSDKKQPTPFDCLIRNAVDKPTEQSVCSNDGLVCDREMLNTLHNAVEWWLNDGRINAIGAPAWVFAAREILDKAGIDDFAD